MVVVRAGVAKGIAVLHGAIITAPVASHGRRSGRILAPNRVGTAAHLHGVGHSAISNITEGAIRGHERILGAHGLEGQINSIIPGTVEHATAFANSDVAQIPRRIHEIGELVCAVGGKKFLRWMFCGGPLGSILLCIFAWYSFLISF